MATIIKREGKHGTSYLIRAYAGYDVAGKQIEKAMTWKPSPGMTPRQIEKALKEESIKFEHRVQSGVALDSKMTFAVFAQRWITDYSRKFHAPNTCIENEKMLKRINRAIGHIRLDKLQPAHLFDFYNKMGEEGQRADSERAQATKRFMKVLEEKGLSQEKLSAMAHIGPSTVSAAMRDKHITVPSAHKIAELLNEPFSHLFTLCKGKGKLSGVTVNKHHRLISAILQAAVEWQVLESNPARRVKAPKTDKREAKYLDDRDAAKLVEALEVAPIKWKTATLMLLYTGIRRGELCGLEWRDVDFEHNLLHILRASQYVPRLGIIEKSTKNKSSERVMKLPAQVFDMLKEYKAWQNQQRLMFGDRWNEQIQILHADGSMETRKNERLFTQDNGLPIDPNSVTQWVRKFQIQNNLPEFTPHTLRHTNISLLIAAGVPIRNIAKRAGHAQLSTTQNIYAHAFETVDEMAADALANALDLRRRT